MNEGNRKSRDELMDWLLQYLWAPLVLVCGYFWRMLHRHDKEIAEVSAAHESTVAAINDAKTGRKEIYDKIETVRKDLTEQHNQLRKDQREDFKDLHKAIAGIGK